VKPVNLIKASGTLQKSSRRLCRGLLQSKNFLVWTSAVINSLIYMSMGGFRRRIKGSIKVILLYLAFFQIIFRSSESQGQGLSNLGCREVTREEVSCLAREAQNGIQCFLDEKATTSWWLTDHRPFLIRRACSKTARLPILDVLQCSNASIHPYIAVLELLTSISNADRKYLNHQVFLQVTLYEEPSESQSTVLNHQKKIRKLKTATQ